MDPDAIENTLSKESTSAAGPETVAHDETTEELVNSLENSVDKAYATIQDTTLNGFNKIQGMVTEKLPELQKQWNDVKLPELSNVNVNVNELTKNLNLENLKLDEYVKKENLDQLKQTSTEFMNKAGENTNKALDNLDSELEKIENLTINYAQQIGGTLGTFIKSQIDANVPKNSEDSSAATSKGSWNWSGWGKQLTHYISGDSPETVLNQEKKTELLFSLPKGISPGTRAESQVHQLQSDSSIYLSAVKNGEFKDYKLTDEQKAESNELLHNASLHLIAVYKKIVQEEAEGESKGNDETKDAIETTESSVEESKISDQDFWNVYFGKREQIMQDEKKRRELLEKSKSEENEEDEDFDWDE
ncbi:hypothetical protein C6P40_000073 [Pichia californica]|uniref:BSD domain-containing protein n=1 Tax=Pichia californica TaxID=460514 RepID=A0A9P6WPT5_9ASCO|nr:hypothetical protein C6P42_000970 [[Candida] californica]KAG0691026.1 hypothetical protein C6P40_000073 [[Candida] californica]